MIATLGSHAKFAGLPIAALVAGVDFSGTITLGAAMILIFGGLASGYFAARDKSASRALKNTMAELEVERDRNERLIADNTRLAADNARLNALPRLEGLRDNLAEAVTQMSTEHKAILQRLSDLHDAHQQTRRDLASVIDRNTEAIKTFGQHMPWERMAGGQQD